PASGAPDQRHAAPRAPASRTPGPSAVGRSPPFPGTPRPHGLDRRVDQGLVGGDERADLADARAGPSIPGAPPAADRGSPGPPPRERGPHVLGGDGRGGPDAAIWVVGNDESC